MLADSHRNGDTPWKNHAQDKDLWILIRWDAPEAGLQTILVTKMPSFAMIYFLP